MADKPTAAGPHRSLVVLGVLVLVAVILSVAQQVLIPLALAILLAFILMPAVQALERRGVRRTPAVLLSVLLAFVLLGLIGWVITLQFGALAPDLLKHTKTITQKIDALKGSGPSFLGSLQESWDQIRQAIQGLTHRTDEERLPPQEVVVVGEGWAWVPKIVGPFVEVLANAVLILILVIFMLIQREDLRNRLIRLIGRGRLTVTTRALDEATHRISRFLVMQLTINSGFGVLTAIGIFILGLILDPGNPSYALLWGFLAGMLRFVPYVGVWIAALFPITYSVAISPTFTHPLAVLGLFLFLELFTANVIEPLLFSHSTGVSAPALLISVVFWTWLWGPLGLLLSTPLTSCLVVLGRYVPQLSFLNILLGSEPALETPVIYYQRLLAHDQDEATDLVEEFLKNHPLEKAYDEVLLPALLMAKRDREREDLIEEDERYIFQVTREILEDLLLPQQQFNLLASGATSPAETTAAPPPPRALIFGCPAQDEADQLVLEMFRQLLRPAGGEVEVGSVEMLSSEVMTWVKDKAPALVCIATLPPGGLAHARYYCKRLRANFPDLKIHVGRWGQQDNFEKTKERLLQAGATQVGTSLLESRGEVIPLIQLTPPAPAPEPGLEAARSH